MAIKSTARREQVRETNQAVVRRLFECVYSKGDLELVDDLVTPDFVGYSAESSEAYLGPKGIRRHVIGLRAAFRGFTVELDGFHAEGDTFEASWTARGTHERRLLDIEPTCTVGRPGEEPHGNRIAVSGVATGTVRNGKVRENAMDWDVGELRRQLGSSVEDAETETVSRESNTPLLERSAA